MKGIVVYVRGGSNRFFARENIAITPDSVVKGVEYHHTIRKNRKVPKVLDMRCTLRPASRSGLSFALLAAVAVAFTVSACGGARPPGPSESSELPPDLETEAVAVVVRKSDRELTLYRYGKMYRRFPVVLGAIPDGDKRYEGDMRTPEGLYRVSDKRKHERWRYFIEIDYPNEEDREVYEKRLKQEMVPTIGGVPLGIGRGLGLHGSDRPEDQGNGKNWTRGCVAMSNAAIEELYRLVDIGTPVLLQR